MAYVATYIYSLIDPRDSQVRYIGKSDDPYIRLQRHIYLSNIEDTHKAYWIRFLLSKNLKPILCVLEKCDIAIWQERERNWIAFYRRIGCDLTNDTEGGDGAPLSLIAKMKIREKATGRCPSKETREKMRIAKLGKKHSLQSRLKQSMNMKGKNKGKKLSEEQRAKISSRMMGNTIRKDYQNSIRSKK